MAHHKLILEDEMDEPFVLLAIHCGEEDYKLAYLLNKHLHTRFKRRSVDLDLSSGGLLITFPIYDFEDAKKYTQYYLVANSCRSLEAGIQSSGGLFSQTASEKGGLHYLIPEFKKADYFLKIYSDIETFPLRQLLSGINRIKEVVSAYVVEENSIKSKNNLIFD